MKRCIDSPRKLKDSIPKITEFKILPDALGKVIGPKGKACHIHTSNIHTYIHTYIHTLTKLHAVHFFENTYIHYPYKLVRIPYNADIHTYIHTHTH